MKIGPIAAAFGIMLVLGAASPARAADDSRAHAEVPAATPDGATIFRVFLTDGTSLVSYGEPARVGDRIVFCLPTAASLDNPPLHLVNLAASHVDWARTERYAETARATRYFATSAEADYALLTGQVASALADVAMTSDRPTRLAIAENARKRLADWPRHHFNYRQTEIRPMLGMLDEIVAELRAASGIEQFDLTFVASADVPVAREPLLPLPTPQEAIEQVLAAARAADLSAERLSLLSAALGSIERDAVRLPSDWRTEARALIRATISAELETDQQYRSLTTRILRVATERARAADVRGIQRLTAEIEARDRVLGAKRLDAIGALLASVEAQLEAARRLRLARDRFALRLPDFRTYGNAMTTPLNRLGGLKALLEDIKALAGSSPFALAIIQNSAAQTMKTLSGIVPPEEFRSAHALFVSAAHLADSASKIRMEAALTGDLRRAWDASSAAAGALMLEARARTELESLFRLPQLDQ